MKLLSLTYYFILDYFLIVRIKVERLVVSNPPKAWTQRHNNAVILVPGVHSTWHSLKKIGETASKSGYQVFTLKELGNNTLPIKRGAKILETFIVKNRLKNITIIAHSKGGVVAKYLLDNSKHAHKIKKIISLATPYHGSWLAYLINSREQTPNSALIASINSSSSKNNIITNLYPKADNFVLPNNSLVLDKANNIKINVIGHTRILTCLETHVKIQEILKKHER